MTSAERDDIRLRLKKAMGCGVYRPNQIRSRPGWWRFEMNRGGKWLLLDLHDYTRTGRIRHHGIANMGRPDIKSDLGPYTGRGWRERLVADVVAAVVRAEDGGS